MTDKEKARAYDEALALMQDCIPDEDGLVHVRPEEIFPELKESEDEKIRKELIQFFSDKDEEDYEGLHPRTQIVAWLEKQCEHAKFCDSIQVGDKVTRNQDGVLVNLSQLNRVAKKDEKQGEQTSDKVEPKFEIEEGEWYICIRDLLDNYANRSFCKGYIYLSTQNGSLIPSNSNVPFKIVCPDTYFRHWTIQDAKDGDVLATEDWIFIFKKIGSNGKPVCHCHYDIELGFRIDTNSYMATGSEIYPATIEQHDLLFQKIKEAGYEWDAEKKELKKVEKKPTEWSEEDRDIRDSIIRDLKRLSGDMVSPNQTYQKEIQWLKSLKEE